MRIYKRGAVYWCQFRNRRVSLRVTDRKAAELAARELQRVAADPTYLPAHATTLGAALQRFVQRQRDREKAEGTVVMHELHVGHVARVLGQHRPLASVGPREIDHYIAKRLAEGAQRSTVGKELSTIRGTLKHAARRGEFHRPLEQVMPDGFAIDYRPLERALTEAEVPRLLAALSPHRAAVCAFIVATAADWRCVGDARSEDFSRNAILVRGTKNPRRWRTVPVLEPFRQLAELAAAHVPFEPWSNVRRDMAAACQRAKVSLVTPRDLRRTHSKILRARGLHPQLIAPMMGHADSRMVELVYGKLAPDELAALVAPAIGTRAVRVPARLRRSAKPTRSKKARSR